MTDNTQAERHSTDTCQPDLVECVLEELVRGVEYANHRYYADKPITGSQYDKIVDKDVSEAKQAILDWHNKQVEEVLERLGVQIDYNKHDFGDMGKFIRIKYVDNLIEAERNKLKESK